ncbi:hypothetical protein StrepF001_42865 [Streptomyces sp. F001]|uniref:hypothetical protein n=1 Tax=Streptomyces sp. F001 TaxID=1510026 RepID=UPI00101E815D|nr:hypothetical protein [Streptomyces sp. F001]RZB13670.1 hypothetical protein StrepF001_42865 [Streptomyces sp. F001]
MHAPQPGRFLTPALLPALFVVCYLTALPLGLADGPAASTDALQRRLARLSGLQWIGLVVMVLSATLFLSHCAPALTRLLEGDRWSGRISRLLRARQRWRREIARRRLTSQFEEALATSDPELLIEVRSMSAWLSERYPMNDGLLRPTALGNALAAAHEQIEDVYGLDVRLAWPRLYHVLGKRMRTEADTRGGLLHMYVSFFVFSLPATAASLIAWPRWSVPAMVLWLAPLGIAAMTYPSAVRAAVAYGSSLRVAFDLHRFDLYDALHLPAPANQERERVTNAALSSQWRHSAFRSHDVPYPQQSWPSGGDDDPVGLPRTPTMSGGEETPEPGGVRTGRGPSGSRAGTPENDGADNVGGARPDENSPADVAGEKLLKAGASGAGVLATVGAMATAAATPMAGSLLLTGVGTVGAVAAFAATELLRRRSQGEPVPAPAEDTQPPTLDYDHRAAHQSPLVQVGDSIREALSPSPPKAFRGGMAVTLQHADRVERVDDEPEWHIRQGHEAAVVISIGLGAEYQQRPQRLLDGMEGVADELLAVSGQSADVVDLDLTVDAPFMTVRPERHSVRAQVAGGQVRFRSTVSAVEAGSYDIRVAVYASGRLVQALPLSLVVDEVPPVGR